MSEGPPDACRCRLGVGVGVGHIYPPVTVPGARRSHPRFLDMMMMILLLFLQKQNLASAIYLFGLGTRLSGPGLKHMR